MRLGDERRRQVERVRRPGLRAERLHELRHRAAVVVHVELAEPGRRARLADLDRVLVRLLVGERDQRDVRRERAEQAQRAPVEGLDGHAGHHAGLSDHRLERARKGERRHGLLGVRRVDLGLDVEAHRAVAALLDEREHIGEPRDALAVHRHAGPGTPRRIRCPAGCGRRRTGGVPAYVRSTIAGPGVARKLPAASRVWSGFSTPVVAHHHDAVLGDAAVELERRDADTRARG